MKIEQFIEEFHKSQNKEAYVKKHVVNTYVPYEKKITIANAIVKRVMRMESGDVIRNTPAIYMNYVLALVKEYTDIEIMHDDSLNIMNSLEENEITPIITKLVGKDIVSFETILKMVVSDEIDNHNDIVNFMSLKSDNVSLIIDKIEETLKKAILTSQSK